MELSFAAKPMRSIVGTGPFDSEICLYHSCCNCGFLHFHPFRLSLEGLPTSAQAVKATLQSPSRRILDYSATFLVFQSPRPWSLGKRNLMYWALIGGAAPFLVLVLDVWYPVPDWIKKVTTLRTSLEMLKVAYYSFWMKTIDFFK